MKKGANLRSFISKDKALNKANDSRDNSNDGNSNDEVKNKVKHTDSLNNEDNSSISENTNDLNSNTNKLDNMSSPDGAIKNWMEKRMSAIGDIWSGHGGKLSKFVSTATVMALGMSSEMLGNALDSIDPSKLEFCQQLGAGSDVFQKEIGPYTSYSPFPELSLTNTFSAIQKDQQSGGFAQYLNQQISTMAQNKIKEDKIKITLERKEEIKNIKKDINILISEADNLVEKYNFDKTVKEEK